MHHLLASIAIVCVLTALEQLRPARAEPADRWRNIQAWGLGAGLRLTLLPSIGVAAGAVGESIGIEALNTSAWPLVWGLLAYLVVMDLGEYVFHRLQHAVPILWKMHSLHHSDPSMNATTAERHFWGESLIKAVTIWPLVGLALQPSPAILVLYAVVSLYNYGLHANLPISFGRYSWLLNSPAYHRLHHSREEAHFGSNFAAILPLWDVLARSYRRPERPVETGLSSRPRSFMDVLAWPLRFESPAVAADRDELAGQGLQARGP